MPGIYQYDVEIKSNVAKLLSDMKQVQDRLDTVEGKEYKIKLNVDEKKLSSVISNLEKMLDSLGKGTGDFKQFENLSKELSNVVSEVQSLSKAFGKVDDSGTKTLLSSIQNIDKSLSELSQNILNVNKNMGNMGGNTSGAVKQIENIGNAAADAVKQVDKLADAQSKTNVANGLDSSISKYQEIVSLVKEYYELTSKIKQPTLKRQSRSEDYDRIDGYLLKKAPQKVGTTDIEKDINDRYHKMAKGVNEGSEFAIKAMKSAIQRYWSDVTEMPSDEKLLSSRKVIPYGNKGQKAEYIIPKKYQDLEKSVIQETIAMNQNNAAYEEEQKQIKANNAAIEERLNLIRQSIKQNNKNSDYNGEYKMGLSLKASDRNKKDIFGMTSDLSQEEMLKEICNMLGVEIPQNAEKAKQAIKEVSPTPQESNISSGNKIINEQKTIQSEVDKTRENIKLLSDEYGQLIYANRGVSHTYGAGLNSNRYHGGTFWTKSTDLAANYGSKIEVANLSMNNPLEVDNKGNNWDEIELYENELTKLQEHIEKIKYKSETIQAELNSLSDNDDGFKLPSFDIDYDGNILSSYGNNIDVVESLEKFRDLFFGFVDLDDPKIQKSITDLYGYLQSYARMTQLLNSEQLNTNQVVEIAKELGHDGVIFKNIIDGSDEVTDIFVTLSQDQVHYVETLDSMTVKEKLAESKAQKLVESRKQLYENIKTFSDLDFDSVIKDFQEGIIPNIWSEFLNTQDFDDDFNNIKANLLKYVSELKSEFELPTKDAFHSDIDTSSSVKSLENLEEEIKKIFTDANELQNILDSLHNGKYFHLSWTTDGIDETGADGRVRQLSKLLEEYGYTINNFKSDSDAFDTSGVINAIKEENNVLEQNTQKVKENTQAKEQNANANLNKYDKRLDSYNGKIDKYQATIDRFNDGGWTSDTYLKNVQAVRDAVKQYATLLDNIKTNQNGIATDEDIQNLDEYEKKIKDTIATVTNMSASEKGYSRLAGQKEIDKINKILRENSAMSSEAKAKIKAYKQELISGNPSVSLEKIHGEILKIVNAEELAGRTGRSFFDTLKNSGFHQLAAQMAGMFGFYDVINVIKQAVSTVTELNTQITELAKVSEQSSKQIYADFDSYADIAKEVRGTISDTIAATADWSKNGYSIPDAKQLAEISQLYKNVGDGIDIDAANESLISTLKGFQLEADQAEHIVDVFNEVSNNEAISSGGIGEALQRSAASFNAASTSLEKSVSLVTATNSVLQNPEKVGNMWRTVSARLRGSETELKEMGEDTDGLVTSTSKLQALVKGITGFDIMKDKDTYKDIYDIVLGIGEKWQDLSDIDRASLLEALAGKQQSNALAAALSNIDILKKSYEEATNAEGSAREENEEYSKSIQASIDLAQAKLEQLANDTLNSNFLKGAIDAGGKLIEVLDGIVKSGNAIPVVATAIAAALSFKNVGIDTLVAY